MTIFFFNACNIFRISVKFFSMKGKIEFITDEEIYQRVILEMVFEVKDFLWLGTSDLKDLHVHKGKNMVPFLEILSGLSDRGVAIRLIHAKEPGPAFRNDFDRYPNLITGMERILCPRVHFKTVIVDGMIAYSGSANLTGAGMGAKSSNRRNFEAGFITRDSNLVRRIMEQFDLIWMGKRCIDCQRKDFCTDYKDLMLC
jgi:phosphatidylserine/phosphatidylglycerophosphate/cardiolipin synthase-like enzyme